MKFKSSISCFWTLSMKLIQSHVKVNKQNDGNILYNITLHADVYGLYGTLYEETQIIICSTNKHSKRSVTVPNKRISS